MADNKPAKIKMVKTNMFKEEQQQVLNKILDIVDIDVDNPDSTIKKAKLKEKYDELEELYNDVKKYYSSEYMHNIDVSRTKGMAILRHVLRYHGYKLISKQSQCKVEGKRTTTSKYSIITKK